MQKGVMSTVTGCIFGGMSLFTENDFENVVRQLALKHVAIASLLSADYQQEDSHDLNINMKHKVIRISYL